MAEEKKSVIARREMIKATELIDLGLIYTRPFVETKHTQPVFEGYATELRRLYPPLLGTATQHRLMSLLRPH